MKASGVLVSLKVAVCFVVVVVGFPELGLDAAQAAQVPPVVHEGVDQGALFGGSGLEAVEDQEGAGVDAGFQGIGAGGGFAGLGAGRPRD